MKTKFTSIIILSVFLVNCGYECEGDSTVDKYNLCVYGLNEFKIDIDRVKADLDYATDLFQTRLQYDLTDRFYDYPIDLTFLFRDKYDAKFNEGRPEEEQSIGITVFTHSNGNYERIEVFESMLEPDCLSRITLVHEWFHVLMGLANTKLNIEYGNDSKYAHPTVIYSSYGLMGIFQREYLKDVICIPAGDNQ